MQLILEAEKNGMRAQMGPLGKEMRNMLEEIKGKMKKLKRYI